MEESELIMSLVGMFPGLTQVNRRTIRAPVNPLDKSTIVSILPKPISERKLTLTPSVFELNPGTYDNPAVLVVGPSSWWKEVDENQPLLEIPVSSVQIADSVVRDYCAGILGCNMGDQMPGLFFIPGEFTVNEVKTRHKPLLDDALKKQRKWLAELVRVADILWARTNGNPLSISDDARLACKELNITQKPWLGDFQTMELTRCPACGTLRNPNFPVCANCKAVIDKEKAASLKLEFVK